MQEEDFFSPIANAERYFKQHYGHCIDNSKFDIYFTRWLSIHFGITVSFDIDSLFKNSKEKPWRQFDPYCNWMLSTWHDQEKAMLFKMRFT